MSVAEFNFGIDQGSDGVFPYIAAFADEDPSGDPASMVYRNFTGMSVRMSFYTSLTRNAGPRTLVLALTIGAGLALTSAQITGGPPAPAFPNGFSFTITKAQSLLLPDGATLYYDAFVDNGGLSTLYLQGTCIVGTTVT